MMRSCPHHFAGGLLVAAILAVLILSAVPPVSRDALTHHLFVPRLYLEHGGLYEIPDIKFSYFPMNLDLLYLIPLALGNDISPKYIHFTFGLLTAWLIYGYIRSRLGKAYALWGALLFLTVPVIVKLSTTVYVDLGLVFFSTASWLALFKWHEQGNKKRYLVIAAFFCGLALGTKYNGLICLFLLSALVPILYLQCDPKLPHKQIRALVYGVCFTGMALIVFSPWMIRNYTWKQNPVYPLGKILFADEMESSEGGPAAMKPMVLRRQVYGEKWWQTALIPLRIFFEGRDDDPRYFDGKLNPLLLLLPIGLFLRFSARAPALQHQLKVMFWFAVFFIMYAFFTVDMRIRYIAPVIPALTILSIFGAEAVIESARKQTFIVRGYLLKVLLVGAVLFWAVSSGGYYVKLFQKITPFEYIGGNISRGDYIKRHRPEYETLDYANHNLKGDIRLLGLFVGDRGYYSAHDIFFDTGLIWRAVKRALKPADISRMLHSQGVTHLLVWHPLFVRWGNHNFDKKQRSILIDFYKNNLKLLYSKSNYRLYQLDSLSSGQ
jgi:hypothetical protein